MHDGFPIHRVSGREADGVARQSHTMFMFG